MVLKGSPNSKLATHESEAGETETQMGTWKRFEDMEVWQKACRLVCEVYEVTREGELAKDFGLRDQIRRAAVSIPSNVAEGFEQDSDKVFARSLKIAKGSSGELRTQLYIAAKLDYVAGGKVKELVSEAEEISKMLAGLIRHLEAS